MLMQKLKALAKNRRVGETRVIQAKLYLPLVLKADKIRRARKLTWTDIMHAALETFVESSNDKPRRRLTRKKSRSNKEDKSGGSLEQRSATR